MSAPQAEFVLPSFNLLYSNCFNETRLADLARAAHELWGACRRMDTTELERQLEQITRHSEIKLLLENGTQVSCDRYHAVLFPYFAAIWQKTRLEEDVFERELRRLNVRIPMSPALKFYSQVCLMDFPAVISCAGRSWVPNRDLVIDIGILFAIWAIEEANGRVEDTVYAKIPECIRPSSPFLQVLFGCLLLSSPRIAEIASSAGGDEYLMGISGFTGDLLLQFPAISRHVRLQQSS